MKDNHTRDGNIIIALAIIFFVFGLIYKQGRFFGLAIAFFIIGIMYKRFNKKK